MGNTLRDIRRRIKSVKSTQQITRAMKMVAAAKFRRAEEKVDHAHRFASRIEAVMAKLAPEFLKVSHPYVSPPELDEDATRRALVVLMTSDRGLCGSFNSNIHKRAMLLIKELKSKGFEVEIFAVGKKGRDFFKKRGVIKRYIENARSGPGWGVVRSLAFAIDELFRSGDYQEVHLVYADFVNVTRSIPTAVRILPVEIPDAGDIPPEFENVIIEPPTGELVSHILDRYLAIIILCAMYVNYASENAARMVAMDNATSAAGDMIDALTLEYNKARQSTITKELLDIVGGAEAMK